MLLINLFAIALIGRSLAVPEPNPMNRINNDPRNPALVFASTGDGKVFEDEQKAGFRRSIPPGAFGLGGVDAFGATGLGIGTGLLGTSSLGLGTGLSGIGGLGIGAGLGGNSLIGTGLGNNFIGNGLMGTSLGGVGAGLNPALGFRNSIGYSPFGTSVGGFGTTGLFNQHGLGGSVNWPYRQGLMTSNGLNGFGGLNDFSGYSGLGINGLSGIGGYNNFAGIGGLSGINTFRNGFGGLNDFSGLSGLSGLGSLNGFNNYNNFGSLSNGINGFSSLNALNTRSGLNNFDSSRLNGGLNSFSSFNGAGQSGFTTPIQFGGNAFGSSTFGDNNSFKRSPLDPTSPYYTQLYDSGNVSGQDEQNESGFGNNKRNTGTGTSLPSSRASSVISHSVGSQVRTNSNASV